VIGRAVLRLLELTPASDRLETVTFYISHQQLMANNLFDRCAACVLPHCNKKFLSVAMNQQSFTAAASVGVGGGNVFSQAG
jgi:hypothetical protein